MTMPMFENSINSYLEMLEEASEIMTAFNKDSLSNLIGNSSSKKTDTVFIENVIFNDPATIVYWSDNTKTVVKAHNEPFDKEKGLAMAISKKVLGNKSNFNDVFKKYIKD